MSALDQAFIKAYVRHGSAPAAAVLDFARPVHLAEALSGEPLGPTGGERPAVRPSVDALAEPEVKTVAEPMRETAMGCSAKTSTGVSGRPRAESPRRRTRCKSVSVARRSAPRREVVGRREAIQAETVKAGAGDPGAAAADRLPGKPKGEAPAARVRSGPGASVSAATLFSGAAPVETAIPGKDPAAAKASEDRMAEPLPGSGLRLHSPAEPSEPSAPAEDSSVEEPRATEHGSDPAKDRVFRPMLEVDRFQWPAVVSRLDTGTGGPLEPLIDALIRGARRGWKVVAVAGCQRGDGCTTAALAASRQLARQGLRVVLADADFQDPRLSKRLGLAPQCGWEEALGGRVPLEEVAIESLFDRLVLLPACRPPTGAEQASEKPWDAAAAIGVLRERYDLIVLDLGRLYKRSKTAIGLFDSAGRWIDVAVLVHNVRSTSSIELTQAHERLRAAGIAEVFVVENFV